MRRQTVANHAELGQLLHQRFLGIDMFVMFQRREQHRRVVKIRRVDDHGIKTACMVGEPLPVILQGPGVGMILLDLVELPLVHVAEAGEFDHRMALESASLQAADAADTDLEDAQFAVSIDLGSRRPRKR